jgi:hypothetical protein
MKTRIRWIWWRRDERTIVKQVIAMTEKMERQTVTKVGATQVSGRYLLHQRRSGGN